MQHGTRTPSPEVAAAVRALLAENGSIRTAAQLQSSRETITRIAARLPVRHGSLVAVEGALAIAAPARVA